MERHRNTRIGGRPQPKSSERCLLPAGTNRLTMAFAPESKTGNQEEMKIMTKALRCLAVLVLPLVLSVCSFAGAGAAQQIPKGFTL